MVLKQRLQALRARARPLLERPYLTAFGIGSTAASVVYLTPESIPSRSLKGTLFGAADRFLHTKAAVADLWQSLKDRVTSASVGKSASASRGFATSIAQQLSIWSEHTVTQDRLLLFGGQFVLDWLLDKALSAAGDDQQAAEQALINLLRSESSASALLSRPEAGPKLLEALERSRQPAQLQQVLQTALQGITLPPKASLDDLRLTINVAKHTQHAAARTIAVQLLGCWAEASVLNCGKLAAMQVGPALTQVAAASSGQPDSQHLQHQLCRTMGVLVQACSLKHLLGLGPWLQHLLLMAADAAAAGDTRQAAMGLEVFAVCLKQLPDMQGATRDINACALLDHLASTKSVELQHAIAVVVAALSPLLAQAQREQWTDRLLRWLCRDQTDEALRYTTAGALAALAEVPGADGLQVAGKWLGELLVTLSMQVKPHHSIAAAPSAGEEDRQILETVAVDPVFARSIAAELETSVMRSTTFLLPDPDALELLHPAALKAYPAAAAAVEIVLADAIIQKALKVLCALISPDPAKQRWLHLAGMVPLLQRLTLQRSLDTLGDGNLPALMAEPSALGLQRQSARMLALLASDPAAQPAISRSAWVPWLQRAVHSEDCALASNAGRTLLNLESARFALSRRLPLSQVEAAFSHRAGISWLLDEEEALPEQEGPRLKLRDGVHLFCPTAAHHHVLAQRGCATTAPGAPTVDVVFVHGIQGGAFSTWRAERAALSRQPNEGRAVSRQICWPGVWLSADAPKARLLSMKYAAPVTAWQGESLPVRGTVEQLLDRLTAAGVGQRPVVFVCHSLGGLLVKEMLAKAFQDTAKPKHKQVGENTRGVVFYACPNTGSWMADWGWQLRFVGASPSASIMHLRRGKHLEDVNQTLQQRHEAGLLEVLSFGEGLPTRISRALPQVHIVPPENANPGYGDYTTMVDADHVNTCKPLDQSYESYTRLRDFLLVVQHKLDENPEQQHAL
ncbi:hypothetical protein WJX74_002764 [Apatococcus lobatus]|uniref:Protein SERAC1 n=2 Tax=Apatococcus TaxID=904362 RepID=A0AAW1SPF1_9CHLO